MTVGMAKILLILRAQIFLAALGCFAQPVSLPEAPQVGAKNHIVSLTLHAVNEDGRDAFAFVGRLQRPQLPLVTEEAAVHRGVPNRAVDVGAALRMRGRRPAQE